MSRVGIVMTTQPAEEPEEEAPEVVQRLMTAREVAVALRVSSMTVYRMVDAGALPALRVGRQLRITAEALAAYVVAHTTPAGEQAS